MLVIYYQFETGIGKQLGETYVTVRGREPSGNTRRNGAKLLTVCGGMVGQEDSTEERR
jgi:hypothetical protein